MQTYKVSGQRISNSGLTTYLLSLPILDALEILEIPDPGKPFPGNRRVNKKHAMEFGNYWEREPGNWIVPPILIDSEIAISSLKQDVQDETLDLFKLELPFANFGSLKILDGQHRILGWYLKSLELELRKADATTKYNKAIVSGDQKIATEATQELEQIEKILFRLRDEKISVNLIDSLDDNRHQQFFVDIAKNALGINKTVQAKFDNSSVINRAAQFLIKTHPLLVDLVDLEKTSCSGTNENILSVVNVADIVRHVCFGISSRVTARKESIFEDDAIMAAAKQFLDVMERSFPILQKVAARELSAVQFRESSLLGSGTIWRCFAGAFFEVCVENDETTGEILINRSKMQNFADLLGDLGNKLQLPISKRWINTGLFPNAHSKAPSSRAQDLSAMVQVLKTWALELR